MKYSRRKFLGSTAKALVTAGALTALPKDLQAKIKENNEEEIYEKGLSILQGLTTENTTQLSVDVPKEYPVHYRLVDFTKGRAIHPRDTKRVSRNFSSWAVDQIIFDSLELGITYLFQVLDENGKIIDERELSTADLSNIEARLGIISCMFDMSPFKGIWKHLKDAETDYNFLLGDNVYGDIGGFKAGPKLLWRRYIETRRKIPYYHQRRLTPTLALWDDHDFGKNNANHRYKHKEDSLDVFNSFFPRNPIEGIYEQGPGCASIFRAFGHDFVFVDNRYYRDIKQNGSKSFWGSDQFNWVNSQINRTRNPKWLLQGSQFFGQYLKKDQTFETPRYREEFDAVMKMLRDTNLPSLFLSGDVHFSEVMHIERDKAGYKTYELTASHMHSFLSRGYKKTNKRRRRVVGEANFMTIDLINAAYGALYEVQSIRKSGDLAFRDVLQIY